MNLGTTKLACSLGGNYPILKSLTHSPIMIRLLPHILPALLCALHASQAEGKLSPDGKKIPTRGRGASRLKQQEACVQCDKTSI